MAYETELAAILCSLILGGEAEVSHPYSVGYDLHRIRVDCETDTQVVEVGKDKRSSLDSVQQALFASELTGKTPMVVMIDTDGREGPFELRVRTVAQSLGVPYRTYTQDYLIRWKMTSWLREMARPVKPNS
ncbi:hypothetical protein ILP92_07895 [Maribius pontilimi]|uniref:Uncharacterized protein n=1 Tax=Palleronia pontilimi TaxID=1964209 RepID=A0A934M9K9_9RHOB|nr:hypothetical protein [Palleronia pontilimi]MBJ3762662.1 hypothetical protein [Palleronia pontilimi]